MALLLVCECGNRLRVPEAHAGRRVQCPRCGASRMVTEQSKASPHPGPRLGTPGQPWKLLLLPLLAGLLLGLLAAGWWFLHQEVRSDPDDLALIPADAPAFVSVRMQELWNTALAKQVLQDARFRDPITFDVTARIENGTGLHPEEIDRISVVSVDLERQIGWVIARTIRPYNRDKVAAKLQQPREGLYMGKSYLAGADPEGREVAVYFVSPTVLVASTEEGVKTCLAYTRSSSRGVKGPLSPILALCNGPHHLVAGFNPGSDARRHVEGNEVLAPLAEVRLAQLTIEIGEQAVAEARARTTGEVQAKKIHDSLTSYVSAAKLYFFGLSFKRDDQGKAAQQLSKLLGLVKIEQQGADVTASMKADAATLLGALPALSNAMGR